MKIKEANLKVRQCALLCLFHADQVCPNAQEDGELTVTAAARWRFACSVIDCRNNATCVYDFSTEPTLLFINRVVNSAVETNSEAKEPQSESLPNTKPALSLYVITHSGYSVSRVDIDGSGVILPNTQTPDLTQTLEEARNLIPHSKRLVHHLNNVGGFRELWQSGQLNDLPDEAAK